MCQTDIRSRRPVRNPATRAIARALAWAGTCAALACPALAASQVTYSSSCQVTETTRLENFGRSGQAAELSHFSCRISGGPLDGAAVTGTNIWDMADEAGGKLLGSIAVAQRAGASVMYEVHDVVRRPQTSNGRVVGWEATSWGVYKAASGSAIPLVGRTFSSVARFTGPRTFTIDNTIDD